MDKLEFKLEDSSCKSNLLDLIATTKSWMGERNNIIVDEWKNLFDNYEYKFGNNFKISTCYNNGKLVAFATGLYSTKMPQWYHMQHFSVLETKGLSKTYLKHAIKLTDILARYGESIGYYSYLSCQSHKHSQILDKIYNDPRRDLNYFRYIKLYEWAYDQGEDPKFLTHQLFTSSQPFPRKCLINSYVLRPEFR